ncbi:hypothetical protein KP509_24G039400 [Ceratopteris richardii]|uniref:trans-cinnamate 4-monooxygenase n=1 Tax=Ceratopteris richardii TaxID=49495 RepID=A0A8T2RX28_CERRI|nr:hypothetical protein KP509_24G039400 [Ceratopteris richardii]KAH7299983.1 hypothetical protein KP509_24G039400 [Ceratopteris richardii]
MAAGILCADLFSLSISTPVIRLLLSVLILTVCSGFFLKHRKRRLKLPPGPLRWPVVGSLLQFKNDLNHKLLALLAKKYGDIFMLQMGQRTIVVVSSPELAEEVLHTHGIEFASRKGNFVYDIFTGNGKDMVFTAYGDSWRRMRRIMTVPLCTNKVVKESHSAWEHEIDRVIEDLTSRRESFTSGVFIRSRLQLMVYNVIYRMMFNHRFEDENDPIYVQLKAYNTQTNSLAESFEYNYGEFLPLLKPLLSSYRKECQDLQEKRQSFLREKFLEERRKAQSAGKVNDGDKCAVDRILRDEMNHEINEENILYMIESLNMQAIETTLCSLEWVLAELINNQKVQDKLRNEIDSVLDGAQLTEPHISKLTYLMAVIKESLRLHMPIPLLMPHMNLKKAKLGQYDIPSGAKVLVNAWWIGNNPDIWESPDKFMPERFIEHDIEPKGSDFRFLPFGSGRRCCPGSVIALPLLALVVGRLVQTYELLPGPELDGIDMSEKGGQTRLHLLHDSLIRVRVRA